MSSQIRTSEADSASDLQRTKRTNGLTKKLVAEGSSLTHSNAYAHAKPIRQVVTR